MCRHVNLTLRESEDIMLMRRDGRGVSEIARAIGRDKSTVSRELKRNSCERFYRAAALRLPQDRVPQAAHTRRWVCNS